MDVHVQTAGVSSCPWAGWICVTVQLCKECLTGPPTSRLLLSYQEKQQPQNKPSLLGALEAGPTHLQSRCLPAKLQIPSPLPTCGLCSHRWTPRLKAALKKEGCQLGVPRPSVLLGPWRHRTVGMTANGHSALPASRASRSTYFTLAVSAEYRAEGTPHPG